MDFQTLLETYHCTVVRTQVIRSGSAPWRVNAAQQWTFDAGRSWREVVVWVRRDAVCERCGASFSVTYQLRGDAHVRYHQAQLEDAAFEHALRGKLRRRERCPVCHALQREPRHALLSEEWRAIGIGLIGILGSVGATVGLGVLGAWLGESSGFVLGLLLGLGVAVFITRWMLERLMG